MSAPGCGGPHPTLQEPLCAAGLKARGRTAGPAPPASR
ncbi:hypothetical protein CSB93_4180 [Pseudomonas paraeruginosa]|uniref:Uncharacterized protein n=1 Tax=Pseudomonas paraeruginosa TaxID=2994495 RepID=A0A2R3IZI3_9PSED|nr:hypothetical protein CSB93_4180 [Pseudomonas paraeruginosa]